MADPRKRPSQITLDLKDQKEPWLQWCQAQGLTPSEAFRRIVANLPASSDAVTAGGKTGQVVPNAEERPSFRKEIMLTASEVKAIARAASVDGLSVAKWLVALIRARLTRSAQISQTELEVLTQSNLRVLAIGKNLNQVAKSLNIRGDSVLYDIALIEGLEIEIRTHAAHVSDVITANIDRWRIEP